MGNATRWVRQNSTTKSSPCQALVSWAIASLIVANLLFLGQKIPVASWIANPRTRAEMDRTEKALEHWRKEHGRYPATLGEMAASPAVQTIAPTFYDASGNRLQYLRLGYDSFILRSFGADSQPASLQGPNDDLILESNTSRYAGGIVLKPANRQAKQVSFSTWPAILAEGFWSPDGQWIARIAANPETGEKRILVIREDRSRVLLSPHDRVEEFTWENSSEPSIVFTATGSDLYEDGVFRWRLAANGPGDAAKMENLLPQESPGSKTSALPGKLGASTSATQTRRWVVALVYPEIQNRAEGQAGTFHVLAVPERDLLVSRGKASLFSPANLWECPPDGDQCRRMTENENKTVRFQLAIDHPHSMRGTATQALRMWSRLPVRGTAQELLEAWFEAAGSDTTGALRPYVLFHAIILQDEIRTSKDARLDPEALRTLTHWADGMTGNLMRNQDTPRYLQALVAGADRTELKNKGHDGRPLFEVIDSSRVRESSKNESKKNQIQKANARK